MKIALITHEVAGTENLPPRLMATALTARGHQTIVYPLRELHHLSGLLDDSLQQIPGMIVLYLRYPAYSMAELAAASLARKKGYRGIVVCFGPLAVFQTQWILDKVPAVDGVIGVHAEESMVALANCIAADGDLQRVPSFSTRTFSNPAIPGLGGIQWRPQRETTPGTIHDVPIAKVTTTRGCQYRCAYCIHAAMARKTENTMATAEPDNRSDACRQYRKIQRRPLSDLLDEMKTLYSRKGVRYFFINDENPVPTQEEDALQWARDFKDGLMRHRMTDVALGLKTRADRLTQRTVDALVDLGVVRTLVGVETATGESLKNLGRKGSAGRARTGMAMLADAGVITLFNSLLIHPGATVQSVLDDLDFLETVSLGLFKMVTVRPYAGTEVRARLQEKGLLRGGSFLPMVEYEDPAISRFARLTMRLDSRVLGMRDPYYALLDQLLGALLNDKAGSKIVRSESRDELWRLIEPLNRQRVASTRQLLACAINDTDPAPVLQQAVRAFDDIHRQIAFAGARLYADKEFTAERHFRAMAAAATFAFVLPLSAGCNQAQSVDEDTDSQTETNDIEGDTGTDTDDSTQSSSSESEADTDTGEDTDPEEEETDSNGCTVSDVNRDENSLEGWLVNNCGYYSGICCGLPLSVHLDSEGHVSKVSVPYDETGEMALCYEDLLKDETFPCLLDEDFNIYPFIAE